MVFRMRTRGTAPQRAARGDSESSLRSLKATLADSFSDVAKALEGGAGDARDAAAAPNDDDAQSEQVLDLQTEQSPPKPATPASMAAATPASMPASTPASTATNPASPALIVSPQPRPMSEYAFAMTRMFKAMLWGVIALLVLIWANTLRVASNIGKLYKLALMQTLEKGGGGANATALATALAEM
jgi:hypothetical protein